MAVLDRVAVKRGSTVDGKNFANALASATVVVFYFRENALYLFTSRFLL